jgi:hypothetical protein
MKFALAALLLVLPAFIPLNRKASTSLLTVALDGSDSLPCSSRTYQSREMSASSATS